MYSIFNRPAVLYLHLYKSTSYDRSIYWVAYISDLNWDMRLYFSFYKKDFTMFMIPFFILRYVLICEGWVTSIYLVTHILSNTHLKPTIFNLWEKVYHNINDTFSIFRLVLIWEGWVIAIWWRTFLCNNHLMNRCFIFTCCSVSHMVATW